MANYVKQNPLKPLSRGVSIIGVGTTPNMHLLEDPDLKHITEGELFGYAAIEAMKDAGLTAKDVDFYIHGQAGPHWQSRIATPNMHVADWFGMRGKASVHHSQACCTGYVALEQAVSYVASGAYDVVLTGAIDTSYSIATPKKPSFMRQQAGMEVFLNDAVDFIYNKDYTMFQYSAAVMCVDSWIEEYARENGLTAQQVDDLLCYLSYHSRRCSVADPYALIKKSYDEMAREVGMEDGIEFLRSKFNPHVTKYCRLSNREQTCDGAAAAIVCASDIAHRFTDRPVEVLAIGHSCLDGGIPRLEKHATIAAYTQVRELTGLTGADMDLLMVNDFDQTSQLLTAEATGYVPAGEGWKYAIEGRLAYDGDRPVNTNGGRCNYGAAAGQSGLADLYHVVKQMRGEQGANQVKHPVKHAMIRGFGGGQNVTCAVLKNNA